MCTVYYVAGPRAVPAPEAGARGTRIPGKRNMGCNLRSTLAHWICMAGYAYRCQRLRENMCTSPHTTLEAQAWVSRLP